MSCVRKLAVLQEMSAALRLQPAVFSLYMQAKRDAHDALRRIKLEQARQQKEERQRLAELKSPESVRKNIIDNILTQRCPKCKAAFVDWDGCIALHCSRCMAGFCAVCLKHCKFDAHSHCSQCPWVRSGGFFRGRLFPGKDNITAGIRAWRRAEIKEATRALTAAHRRQVLESIKPQLEGVGLGDVVKR
jgi:hypothetical protein